MTMQTNIKTLFSVISKLAKSEGTSKQLLGALSRDILALHSGDSDQRHDVRVVNKLLSILSPVNKRAARLFFCEFLPYTFDKEVDTFGKLQKKEAIRDAKQAAMVEFLADPANDIWSWQKDNVKMEAKPVDYKAKLSKLAENAMNPEKGGLSQADVLRSMFEAGITVDAVIELLTEMEAVNVVEAAA